MPDFQLIYTCSDQQKIWHQDSSPNNGNQGNMPHWESSPMWFVFLSHHPNYIPQACRQIATPAMVLTVLLHNKATISFMRP